MKEDSTCLIESRKTRRSVRPGAGGGIERTNSSDNKKAWYSLLYLFKNAVHLIINCTVLMKTNMKYVSYPLREINYFDLI
jgi:hypothetical protein